MRRLQRYALWIMGWTLLLLGLYLLVSGIVLVKKAYGDASDFGIMQYASAYASIALNALQAIAIALLCMFAARICKLETDAEFKHDISKVIRRLRNVGDKTDTTSAKSLSDLQDK